MILKKLNSFSYTIKEEIFDPALNVIEKLQKEETKSCIVGGIAVQTYIRDHEKYLRDTSDIDILTDEQLNKKKFRNLVGNAVDRTNEKYGDKWEIISRTPKKCKGGEIDIINKETEDILQIHIPFYPEKYWEKKKDEIKQTIQNSKETKIWGHNVFVTNIDDLIKSKITRMKIKTKFEDQMLNKLIEENKENILNDPDSWKEHINKLRRALGEAYDDNNGIRNERTKKIRDSLSLSKDLYDIVVLGKIKNKENKIKEYINKITEKEVFKKT